MLHNLGGVQTGAPNATSGFHCSGLLSTKGRPASITLILKTGQGTVLATKSGTSVDVLATAAAAALRRLVRVKVMP